MSKTVRAALAALMIFVLVSGLVTGCGSPGGSEPDAQGTEAVTEEAAETAEDQAGAAEEQTAVTEDQAETAEGQAEVADDQAETADEKKAAAEEEASERAEAEETRDNAPDGDQGGRSGKGTFEEKTDDLTVEETDDPTVEETDDTLTVEKNGRYTSKEEVALYIHTYGRLPSNYISKRKAEERGWVSSKGNLDKVLPGMSIGGSRYSNYEGLLPDGDYRECDINYSGGFRGPERIVFSDDGRIYYTADHYKTFEQLY